MFGTKSKCLGLALVVLVASLGVFAALSSGAFAGQAEDRDKVALKLVAEHNNVPAAKLVVLNSARAEFPLTGKTAFQYKVADKISGAAYGIALDADGKEVDAAKLQSDENAAYAARYGKLDKALADQLATAPSDAPVKVVIVVNEPSYMPERPPAVSDAAIVEDPSAANVDANALKGEEQLKALAEKESARRAAAVEKVVTPVADRLKKGGHKIETSQSAPMIFAELKPNDIKDVAKMDEVKRVFQDTANQPQLNIARPTILANNVYNKGIAGFGIKVGEVEVGGQVAQNNPYLAPPLVQDTLNSCLSGHSTGVAGIIRSWNPTYFGISPGAWLWVGGSCLGSFSELQSATQRAITFGALETTNSWGSIIADGHLTAQDLYYDGVVRNQGETAVFAAGNNGNTGFVVSPGTAYNVITVGAFDDMNTVSWSDDVIASYSSGVPPFSTHGDRIKPEVAAPGSNIISTTTAFPWVGSIGSGTSFATPMVAGEVAMLLQRKSGLRYWPEPTKAIVMTTAMHNIVGDPRLSLLDGAGGITVDRADNVANGVGGNWGDLGNFVCGGTNPQTLTTMSLTAGVRTRAAIVWDQDPSYSDYLNKPAADLDLWVVNSANTIVAISASFDNTYEIVDFTPAVSGTYTLKVNRFRCDLDPQFIGWAWRKGT